MVPGNPVAPGNPVLEAGSDEVSEFIPQHDDMEQLKVHVERFYLDLPRLGHYELLGLTIGASPEQIKQAFYETALFMHPDRHASCGDQPFKQKLQAIYKRVTECYRVLLDPRRRREYDVALRLAEREEYEAAREATALAQPVPGPEPKNEPCAVEDELVMLDGSAAAHAGEDAIPEVAPIPEPEPGIVDLQLEPPGPDARSRRRQPVDVVLEDTAPAPSREPLPTPTARRHDSDGNLPAPSEPVPGDEEDDLPAPSFSPLRPKSAPRAPALAARSAPQAGERYGSARLTAVKARRRPVVGVLVGLLISLGIGAVVPCIYSGWVYFARVQPLQQKLRQAEVAATASPGDAWRSRQVEKLDRSLFEVIWTHMVISCVFWGILSVIVGTVWFRRR